MALPGMAAPRCLLLLLILAAACPLSAKKNKYEGYTVHVIFSNHLDVGFTDLDNKVIDLYFHKHLLHAAQLAKDVETSPNNTHGDTFKYLSHSWLLDLFLDCPPGLGVTCPNTTEVAAVSQAIQQGAITWHAMPFNPQYEVFDASLLRFAVGLTHRLDQQFDKPTKRMASLRDVPGMTRAAIPILASSGVLAMTSGVNGFSAPPGVPKTTPFIWLDEQTGTQLIYMVHPGGYAGVRPDGLHIDSHRDCIRAPGLKHVLCSSWGDDNLGPPSNASQVLAMFDHVRQQWPGASVQGSTLEAYLDGVLEALAAGGVILPVVTGEVGDTWIHGIGADPGRMADYRAVLRARRECEASEKCDSQGPAYFNFSRLLLKVPEHTWGASFNQYFGDFTNYTNAWLQQHLVEGEDAHPGLGMCVESWRRQRRYIDWALEALPPIHPIVTAVAADRAARNAASSVSTASLAASAALPMLPIPADPSEVDALTSGDRAANATAAAGASTAAAAAARVQAAGAACTHLLGQAGQQQGGHSKQPLLFCSDSWLLEVDRHTGGLLRLQRVYRDSVGPGGKGTQHLGNDWAGGHHRHKGNQLQQQQSNENTDNCICEQQQQHHHHHHQQQYQHQPEPGSVKRAHQVAANRPSWLGSFKLWLHKHTKSLAAWLPSPDAAAVVADFAVGDEAQHTTAGRSAARREQHSAAAAAAEVLLETAAGSIPRSTPCSTYRSTPGSTAAYRRLLSWAPFWGSKASQLQQQQQQQHGYSGKGSAEPVDHRTKCDCDRRPAFAELQYNVYSLQDYDPVWEHYAYIYPVWVGDFGKNNMSASINMSEVARPRLLQVYDKSTPETGLHLALELSFAPHLVKHAGAPLKAWLLLESPPTSHSLHVTLVWQGKTATRLPEALWLRFKPGRGSVDPESWLLHKLDGAISPSELALNGSHSLHAINQGVSVHSSSGLEQLHIHSTDVPLVSVGAPNPLPSPCDMPDMDQGVSFNPVNNIWGTNYAMWVPYMPTDADMAFGFTLDASETHPATPSSSSSSSSASTA